MSNWILVGPVAGVVLIAAGFVLGYIAFPPIVTRRIIEVLKYAN